MAMDRFAVSLTADRLYREELGKKLGFNPNSEYGRKQLNRYIEDQRKSDELSARIHLQNANPGKFISYSEIRSERGKIEKKRLAPYVEKAKMIHKSKEPQDASINETKINVVTQKEQETYQEEKINMDKQKEMKFVLFHPVSICIRGKEFKYGIKDNMSYPCLLGFIAEDNKCVEVISGRKFDILSEEDYERRYYVEITKDSKVIGNPVRICRWIDNSVENLHLIEKYIDTKGNLSQRKIAKSSDFSYRLNHLLFNRPSKYSSIDVETGFYDTLKRFEFSKYYLQKIDIENLKALNEIAYILSGQKESNELTEKNDIILRLTKKLIPSKK